jgi:hypothetical protein
MNHISQQRCLNHSVREAAARCPECGRYFCRECITEHEDRVLCAQCLRKTLPTAKRKFFLLSRPVKILQFICGSVLLWIFFYYLGLLLLELPSAFHDGTLWKNGW